MQSHQKPFFNLQAKGDFNKLFPELPPLLLKEEELQQLAQGMVQGHACIDSSRIANGYGIFGQFLAHDITFESSSKLRSFHQPEFLRNDRTPNLDLDCIYGQFTQDFYYDKRDKRKLLLGKEYRDDYLKTSWRDLQRNAQSKAIIPDARNDENILVSRLQVLFIEFHNKVVDMLDQSPMYKGSSDNIFLEARKEVIWHYQWLIVHGYLKKIIPFSIWERAFWGNLRFLSEFPLLPLEFTGAAFRLGHSQTREKNRINAHTEKFLFDLGAFDDMNEYVDFRYLFDLGDGKVEFAKQIDTRLDKAFGDIPFLRNPEAPFSSNLAFLNLSRGQTYGLAAGEDVAKIMGFIPLDIPETKGMAGTPLWFYILKEAEIIGKGEKMGPVGGTLMAETFFSLLQKDMYSYLNMDPLWIPTLAKEDGTFTFRELIQFVYPEMN